MVLKEFFKSRFLSYREKETEFILANHNEKENNKRRQRNSDKNDSSM